MNGERAITTLLDEPCTLIDAYLNGELSGEMATLFERHLTSCATCCETVEQQRWIDGLLRSPEAAVVEAASADMADRVEGKVFRLRRRRMVGRAMMAAAASITAIALWHFTNQRSGEQIIAAPDLSRGLNEQAGGQRAATSPQTRGQQAVRMHPGIENAAKFVSTGDAIVVPVASDDAQVSIVKVYPTTTAERRWRRELTLNAGRAGQDGG
jgi:anti-sigma factor RsiW